MVPVPFVMYCDLETMITSQVIINRGKKKSKCIHRPISFGAITVCKPRPDFGSLPVIYTGTDCIDKLFAFIENWVCYIKRIFLDVYVPCIMSKEDKRCHECATECFMCGRNFAGNPHLDKVRDHCHLSGKFHFTLCSNCNLTHAKRLPELHIFFHGLSNYDSHFLIQKLYKYNTDKISIIPRNSERYLSFSIGCVHFKDSYQFMSESLAVLVQNLLDKGEEHFFYLNKFIMDERQ